MKQDYTHEFYVTRKCTKYEAEHGWDYHNFDYEEFDYETVEIKEEEIPEQQLTLSGVF